MRIQRLLASVIVAAAMQFSGAAQEQRPAPPQGPGVDVALDGDVEVEIEDAVGGARIHYRLLANGRRLTLRFEDAPPYLVTGMRIRARGRLQDDTLTLSNSQSNVETLIAVAPNTFGEQRTIVILVNFRNYQSQPYDVSGAQHVTFQTVNAFFQENSYGQTWLTGDVYGWFTIDMDAPASSCDYNQIASRAESAAAAAGATLSNYRRRIIAFPQVGGCGWWGLGNVGGNPSRAWINGTYALKVVAHELGHNFGDYHSNSMSCDAGGCTHIEYGDSHDVMGNPSSGHLTAFQKERLGWLDYGNSPDIQSVSTSGSYWVDAMSAAGGAKALRILKSTDGSGRRTWYYVEVRSPIGFDAGVAPGVLVHTGSEATGNSSYQVDLAPASGAFDGMLDVGQTFTDPAVGLSITSTSAGSSGAWVQVSYDGAPCATSAPSLSLLPGANLSIMPGENANYTMRVHNQDGGGCPAATFSLGASLPPGWSHTFGAGTLQIPAGGTAETALTIAPGATSGTHGFSASATRSGPGGSTNGSVTVIGAIEASLLVTRKGANHQLTVTVRSGGAPVAGASVLFQITKPDGSVDLLSATSDSTGTAIAQFKPAKRDPRGTHQVLATVTLGALMTTVTESFSN